MADKFITKIKNATLASGDNSSILAATAGNAYKLWQAIVTPGANADVVTFKQKHGAVNRECVL